MLHKLLKRTHFFQRKAKYLQNHNLLIVNLKKLSSNPNVLLNFGINCNSMPVGLILNLFISSVMKQCHLQKCSVPNLNSLKTNMLHASLCFLQ